MDVVTVEDMLTDLVTYGNVSIGLISDPRTRVIATLTPERSSISSPITTFGDTISQALAGMYGVLIARIINKEVTR